MQCEIITIGDEILIGQVIDTNSAWIAGQLNMNGIEVYQATSVHDDPEHIRVALRNAGERVDLVVLTGGLGPTKDDITKKVLCEFFQTSLVFHEPTFELIQQRFKNRNIPLNKLNRDQALVPEICTVLPNRAGTAPGMWFEKKDTIYISLPGVPFEMKQLMQQEVLPRLKSHHKIKAIYHKTVLTQGIPESMLAERIEQWETSLPQHIKLAYLPNPMSVRLRLSATGNGGDTLKLQVDQEIEKLKLLIPEYIFGYDKETLAEVTGRLLLERKQSLAVAESCTGGFISHLITAVPGCSAWFKGSIIAYSNEVKQNILGVSAETLRQYGAVSEQVVREMAEGARKKLNAGFAVATTGIAGPTGGTEGKPVGTVWIAIASPNHTTAEKFVFGDIRERNIIRSGQTALQLLRRKIINENPTR
ncbi:MAG: competence/damage-inducible protein A [Mariniphaga sp.]|nr:competence/damage-inducible protein A [Mariniphaga sp.]